MALNLQDYCYCRFPLNIKEEKTITYDHSGINIFLVAQGSCIAHWSDKDITVNSGEVVYSTGEISVEIPVESQLLGINIDGIIAQRFCKEYSSHVFGK